MSGRGTRKSWSYFAGEATGSTRWSDWDSRGWKGWIVSAAAGEVPGKSEMLRSGLPQTAVCEWSKDILIVQGGLHHLPNLPEDLEQTLGEMHRVVRKNGRLMIVEPWRTQFLTVAHLVSENRVARRLSNKLDALAVMTHYERRTYEQWLSQPKIISQLAHRHFAPLKESFAWGKWNFLDKPA